MRPDLLDVTRIASAWGLKPAMYFNLLHTILSTAIDLNQLSSLCTRSACELFADPVRFNERLVLLVDRIKIAMQDRIIPAVKLIYQCKNSNTKAKYILKLST